MNDKEIERERKTTMNDLAELWVLDNSTIAAKLLLKVLENFVVAEFLAQPLHSC